MGWDVGDTGYWIWDMRYGIWDTGCGGYRIQDMGFGIWDMGCGMWGIQDTGYGIQDMGYGLWDVGDTGYGIWDMGCRIWGVENRDCWRSREKGDPPPLPTHCSGLIHPHPGIPKALAIKTASLAEAENMADLIDGYCRIQGTSETSLIVFPRKGGNAGRMGWHGGVMGLWDEEMGLWDTEMEWDYGIMG